MSHTTVVFSLAVHRSLALSLYFKTQVDLSLSEVIHDVNLGTHYPVHGPCLRVVCTARGYGCQKMTPVLTGRVGHQCATNFGTKIATNAFLRQITSSVQPVSTSRVRGPRQKMTPVFTGRGPWTRVSKVTHVSWTRVVYAELNF